MSVYFCKSVSSKAVFATLLQWCILSVLSLFKSGWQQSNNTQHIILQESFINQNYKHSVNLQSVPRISLYVLIVTQMIKVSTLVAPLNTTLKILIQNTEKKGGLRVKMSETDTIR